MSDNHIFSTKKNLHTFAYSKQGVGEHIYPFLSALIKKETYLPHRNIYFIFGFLWGLPIPVVTVVVCLIAEKTPITIYNMYLCICQYKWQIIFVIHPLLFAVIFGAMGTVIMIRKRQTIALLQYLHSLAHTDGLTGLLNHRAFQERVREEVNRANRENLPIALVLLDIDHFKAVNDTFGHVSGDELLKELAQFLEAQVRSYDVVCRYGGEEFAILLPERAEEEAEKIAERIRSKVCQHIFKLTCGSTTKITVSQGVSCYEPEETISNWIQRTDRQLYRAKHGGRDRVCTRKIVRPDLL